MKSNIARNPLVWIALVASLAVGYGAYRTFGVSNGEARTLTAEVKRGTLVISRAGSGQVLASTELEIKPKVSETIVYVGVENGQTVRAGTLIAQLDTREASKTVRDAEANLESARIALQKIRKPADTLALIQGENSVAQASETLAKAREDGFNAVSNLFLDAPDIISGLHMILFGTDLTGGKQDNASGYSDLVKSYDESIVKLRVEVLRRYAVARTAYDLNFQSYKAVTRFSPPEVLERLILDTHASHQRTAEAVKGAGDFLSAVKDRLVEHSQQVPSLLTTHQSQLAGYTAKTNSHLVAISSARDALATARRSLEERAESLEKLKRGADELDIASAELTVRQHENALLDAKEKLADYFLRATFDGVIAKLRLERGNTVSSGTAVATLITNQRKAEISLNEVDVSGVESGARARLTFDAVPGLTLDGAVASVDPVGSVSQGVVTYEVSILFNDAEKRVRPGMSVSATIVVATRENVLLVPNAAVKSSPKGNYAEVPDGTASHRVSIETGAANDEFTEVAKGIEEGTRVVIGTVHPQTNVPVAQQRNAFRFPGVR